MIQLLKLFLQSFFGRKGHFLILFQNNHELRATGGFITSLIDVSFFKINVRRVFGEMDRHDSVKGPKPLMQMLNDGYYKSWTFRDANYFPEFNESAKHLIQFYNQIFPKHKVDSILAVNFSFVENLLKQIGSVRVRGKLIHAHELFYFLSAEVSDIDRHDLTALTNRKQILMKLGKRLASACLFRLWTWLSIFDLIKQSFEMKDLQVYQKNSEDTFFYEGGQDFLSVIDSNFLGLKSNRYVQRRTFHESVVNNEGEVLNDVRVAWEHMGTYNRPMSGIYRACIRIYLPLEVGKVHYISSSLLADVLQSRDNQFTVFTFKLLLKPGEKLILNLNYNVHHLGIKEYKFKYFKQAGVIRESFHKSVRLPQGFALLPSGNGVLTENLYTYDLALVEKDIVLHLKSVKVKHSPRILKHELVSPNTILVRFSEAIQVTNAIEKSFMLTKKGGSKHFTLSHMSLSEDGTVLSLLIKDLPQVEEEFYSLTLKDIKNLEGVLINPNPRIVTVVYRSRFFKKT